MKVYFYIEQVPTEKVRAETCCEIMEEYWSHKKVSAKRNGLFIQTDYEDVPIAYCPWCRAAIEIDIESA